MSKTESIRVRINENKEKIRLFKLINNGHSKITIDHLKNENIKLKEMMSELNKSC